MIRYVFLRLYGRALSRPRRNDADAACSDAIMHTSLFVACLLISVLWVIAAFVWPPFPDHLAAMDSVFMMPTVAASALVTFSVRAAFRSYVFRPQAAGAYRSPKVRFMTRIWFLVLPALLIVAVGISLRFLAHR